MAAGNDQSSTIKNVWAYNLGECFKSIEKLLVTYYHIAMDTEYPGVVEKLGGVINPDIYSYNIMYRNVNKLKLIQLGMSFFDKDGNPPKNICSTYQFNFSFDLSKESYCPKSIELLKNAGLDFELHRKYGIDVLSFAKYIKDSSLLSANNITWVSFDSHYDFGYLLKILIGQNLPLEKSDFYNLHNQYFPCSYDVKYLTYFCNASLSDGLQKIGNQLGLTRIGQQHQAGSDAQLAGMIFFLIKKMFFGGIIDKEEYSGHFFSLDIYPFINLKEIKKI